MIAKNQLLRDQVLLQERLHHSVWRAWESLVWIRATLAHLSDARVFLAGHAAACIHFQIPSVRYQILLERCIDHLRPVGARPWTIPWPARAALDGA